MLKDEHRVATQIRYIAEVGYPARILPHHPTDVSKPEAAADGVWIAIDVVHVQMVSAVTAAPDEYAVLQRHGAEHQVEDPQRPVSVVRAVGPEAVVAAGDRQSIRIKEKDEEAPGARGVAVLEPVPGHEEQRRQKSRREHERGGPDARGERLGPSLGFGGNGIRHRCPTGSERRL